MPALLARIFLAAALLILASLPARADFQMQNNAAADAQAYPDASTPGSTLPAFQSQATNPATSYASNPADYYANTYGGPTYANAPVPPPASSNGADPGVTAQQQVETFSYSPASYATVGQSPSTYPAPSSPGYGNYPPQAYGAPPQTYMTQNYSSPNYSQAQGYSVQGYGAPPALPAYGAAPPATSPAILTYGNSGYGAYDNSSAGMGATATGTANYGANSYGMSGYGSSYGAQGGPPATTGGQAAGGYQAYPSPPPQQSQYATQGYGTYGSYAGQSAPAAPQAYGSYNSYNSYGVGASSANYGTPSYGQPPQAYAPSPPPPAYNAPAPQPHSSNTPNVYGAPAPTYAYAYGTDVPPYAQPVPYAQPSYVPSESYTAQSYGAFNAPAPYMPPPSYTPPPAPVANTEMPPPHEEPVAMASEPGGNPGSFYFALRSGITFPQDTHFGVGSSTVTGQYKTGWELGGAAGYNFPWMTPWFRPRAELELSNLRSSIDKQTSAATVSDPSAFGSTNTWRVFANGYLDFNTPLRWFTPYIGGGLGVGIADFDRHGVSSTGTLLSDSGSGFAYNIGGGIGIPLWGPNTMLDIGYRYSKVLDVDLTALNGTKSTTDVGAHEIVIGLRQSFGGGRLY